MGDREAYVDQQLGIPHEEPTHEKKLRAMKQIAEDRLTKWRVRGKTVPAPRRQRERDVNKGLDAALGIMDIREGT